jgi:class 3 adenylate cyclase
MTHPLNNSTLVNTTSNELERIGKIASDLVKTLRAQREMLKLRGSDALISAEPIDQLERAYRTLQEISGDAGIEHTEMAQLRALARTTELINSTLDLNVVLNDVIDTVIFLTGAERGYIILKNPQSGEFEFRVARSTQKRSLSPQEQLISHSVIETVSKTQQMVLITDAVGDSRFKDAESVVDLLLRSILCVPLLVKGRLTGMVYADNRVQIGLFSEREQALVSAFANQAAIAIENARLFAQVRASIAEITTARNLMDNVFASIASGVITTDVSNNIQTFTPAAAGILDMPDSPAIRQSVIGLPLWDVLPVLYDGFEQVVQQVQWNHVPQTIETETMLPGRGKVNLTVQVTSLRRAGRDTEDAGVAIVLTDVTELKQRNAQISLLRNYLTPEMVDNITDFDVEMLSGQERMVSVLSCDIRGFTSFSEGMAPEELMEVINQYLTVSSDAVTLREGIIDKFIGDAVIGLYNTQLNEQPDHALRAVQSAMAMVQDVEALHERLPAKYHIRYGIGIHTGRVIVGNIGSATRKEFSAVGETVNYAKFLQENAHGGQVLISAETYDIVKDYYSVEPATPHRQLSHYLGEPIYRVTGRLRTS